MSNKLENKKNKSSWGGKRQNSGRPKGSENPATKKKREALKEFKRRVRKNIDKLFNSQMSLAQGCSYLFCIRTIKKGKESKRITEKVEDPETIKAYLDGDLDGNEDEWYFISTDKPDNKAIDSMLDRVFGRAVQRNELSGKDGESIKIGLDNETLKLVDDFIKHRKTKI